MDLFAGHDKVKVSVERCGLYERVRLSNDYPDEYHVLVGRRYENDEKILNELADIKYQNKVDFANRLYKKQGVLIDPKTRFDVQVKRLHAYKRQLLNVLKIINLYNILVENPNADITPQTYIFGAKAAPGYYHAKEVIELINYIAKDIEIYGEADVNEYPLQKKRKTTEISVIFLKNIVIN